MADYKKIASYDVRKVLWDEIQQAGFFDQNDYYADGFVDSLIPIIPAQQVPEFNNLLPGKSYIVYDVAQGYGNVQWWMSEEVITFDIVSTDPNEIQAVSNLIVDIFRRYDKSAKEVNLQLLEGSPFTFHFFRLESADPVQPFRSEGGMMNGTVSIGYSYTRELDSNTGRYL